MIRITAAVFAALCLSGCATKVKTGAVHIQEIELHEASVRCQYVGDVHGASGWAGIAAATGLDSAKNQARNRASALNATHVAWVSLNAEGLPTALAKAYRCN